MSPVPTNARALTGRPVGTGTRWGRIRALTGLLALTLWMPATASAQLGVDQLELTFKVRQTPAAAQTFQVSNSGSTPLQVTIVPGDWDRSEDGTNRFFTLGETAGSCGEAVTVFPTSLRVEPGRSEAIRVELRPNSKVPCQGIFFVETPPPPAAANGRGAAVTYNIRYGVKVYAEPDMPPAGELVEAHATLASSARGRADTLHFTFRNPGLVQTLAKGKVEIRREDDSVAQTLPIEEFPVLGGALRRVRMPLPALPRGRYAAIVLLDIGVDDLIATQALVEIP